MVPKLIGQKKPSGNEEDTVATVAFDEFRTHSPMLWNIMRKQLLNEDCPDIIQLHSNLIPVLYILSNCAKRYNFSNDMNRQLSKDFYVFDAFMRLLGSPIFNVRKLSAKCIYNNFTFLFIVNAILDGIYTKENFLHGSLLLVQVCYENYEQKSPFKDYFMVLKKHFSDLPMSKHSYLCRNVFEDIYLDEDKQTYLIQVLDECDRKNHAPGAFIWLNTVLNKVIQCCNDSTLPPIIHLVMKHFDFDMCCRYICERVVSDNNIRTIILKDIAVIVMENLPKYHSDIIWRTLYKISLKDITIFEDSPKAIIYNYFEANACKITYTDRYVIPLAARLFETKAANIMNSVYLLTKVKTNVDMRYVSALAVNESGNYIKNLSDEVKITILKSAVVLLQDEDKDVRDVATIFYKTVTENRQRYHPYICLLNILDHTFLNNLFIDGKNSINALCDEFFNIIQEMSNVPGGKNNYNPFATELNNIYFESDIFREIITTLKDKNNAQ